MGGFQKRRWVRRMDKESNLRTEGLSLTLHLAGLPEPDAGVSLYKSQPSFSARRFGPGGLQGWDVSQLPGSNPQFPPIPNRLGVAFSQPPQGLNMHIAYDAYVKGRTIVL